MAHAIPCPVCKLARSDCRCPTIAPKGSACPTCALDVGGHSVGRTLDGASTWDRPLRFEAGPSGIKHYSGGLTHVEGSTSCQRGIGAP